MPVVKDLVQNYENDIDLEITLKKINNQIKIQSNPLLKENLRNWARKYRRKIKSFNEIYEKEKKLIKIIKNDGYKDADYFCKNGMIKERWIEDYICSEGLKINGIKTEEFRRQETLGRNVREDDGGFSSFIGKIDLLGLYKNNLYIIEIKSSYARASAVGQCLAYYQYLIEKSKNNNIEIIIVALGYTRQYKLALRVLKNLNIKIHSIKFNVIKGYLVFEELDF